VATLVEARNKYRILVRNHLGICLLERKEMEGYHHLFCCIISGSGQGPAAGCSEYGNRFHKRQEIS
jgi:hypothetical protein